MLLRCHRHLCESCVCVCEIIYAYAYFSVSTPHSSVPWPALLLPGWPVRHRVSHQSLWESEPLNNWQQSLSCHLSRAHIDKRADEDTRKKKHGGEAPTLIEIRRTITTAKICSEYTHAHTWQRVYLHWHIFVHRRHKHIVTRPLAGCN